MLNSMIAVFIVKVPQLSSILPNFCKKFKYNFNEFLWTFVFYSHKLVTERKIRCFFPEFCRILKGVFIL